MLDADVDKGEARRYVLGLGEVMGIKVICQGAKRGYIVEGLITLNVRRLVRSLSFIGNKLRIMLCKNS